MTKHEGLTHDGKAARGRSSSPVLDVKHHRSGRILSCSKHLAATQNAHAIVRGLRAISDFEFEFQMALMNRKLDAEIETIFLMPKEEYTYLSSRIVKEIAKLGGDVSAFVPRLVAAALAKKFAPKLGNIASVI